MIALLDTLVTLLEYGVYAGLGYWLFSGSILPALAEMTTTYYHHMHAVIANRASAQAIVREYQSRFQKLHAWYARLTQGLEQACQQATAQQQTQEKSARTNARPVERVDAGAIDQAFTQARHDLTIYYRTDPARVHTYQESVWKNLETAKTPSANSACELRTVPLFPSNMLQALHAAHIQSYSPETLWCLAHWYDAFVQAPQTLVPNILQQFDTHTLPSALTPWARDVADYLHWSYTTLQISPMHTLQQLAKIVSQHINAEVVRVRGNSPEWTTHDQQRLEATYSRWTGRTPLVDYAPDTATIAGFCMTTHPVHTVRISYDGTLSGVLTRCAHNVHQKIT